MFQFPRCRSFVCCFDQKRCRDNKGVHDCGCGSGQAVDSCALWAVTTCHDDDTLAMPANRRIRPVKKMKRIPPKERMDETRAHRTNIVLMRFQNTFDCLFLQYIRPCSSRYRTQCLRSSGEAQKVWEEGVRQVGTPYSPGQPRPARATS